MLFLNFFSKNKRAKESSKIIGKRAAAAKKIQRTMHAFANRQAILLASESSLRPRHVRALNGLGVSARAGKIPRSMIAGNQKEKDPWWSDEDVRKFDVPANVSSIVPSSAEAGSPRVIDEKVKTIKLLDGREVKAIRQVLYDPKTRTRSKRYWTEKEDGSRVDFDAIPKNLIPLYRIDEANIDETTTVVVVEGTPATDRLRELGFEAVGTMTGAFMSPSERAMAPLLDAKNVILWPDNDSVGAQHMQKVARRLSGMGVKDIRIARWRGGPRKGDAADFEGSADDVRELLRQARTWSKSDPVSTDGVVHLRRFGYATQLRLPSRLKPPSPELTDSSATADHDPLGVLRSVARMDGLSETQRRTLHELIDRLAHE